MIKRWFALFAVIIVFSAGGIFASRTGAAPSRDFGVGWTAQYFNNTSLSGTPVFTESLPSGINFFWGTGSPNPAVPSDNFSARYTSVQQFNAGTYQFSVQSDDGVRVFIDGVIVLDRFVGRVLTNDTFSISLTQGPHTLVVEYFEGIDQAALQFQWFQVSTGIVGTPTVFGAPTATFGPTPSATRIPPTSLPAIPPGALTGTVVRATVLLTRSEPYIGAPVVGRVLRGQTYAVIGRDADARWFLLQLSGFQGWVWGYYLFVNGNEFNAPVVGPFTTSGAPSNATGVVIQTNSGLRLRAAPTTESAQIGRIPWGEILPVIGRTASNGWVQVEFRGTIGWVSSGFFDFVEGDLNTVPVTG
ncbi:MAG: SH3 domain-containing protein [Pleurocapsa minor GSE-CHR-MK-17-07R]|jgi:uncharacterized protein YgiM (DUF1202 family)|nr:SH3 domain-containing protein [Pleurocapsa minor GSE-CHR-MK 17-07R]